MTIKFAHIRPKGSDNRQGGYTIAFMNVGDNGVSYAVARCNAKDNFNKSTGRAIAAGRLSSGLGKMLSTKATKYKTILNKIIPLIEAEIKVAQKSAFKRKK